MTTTPPNTNTPTTPTDPLHGYSPDEIVIGPDGETVADASADAEVARRMLAALEALGYSIAPSRLTHDAGAICLRMEFGGRAGHRAYAAAERAAPALRDALVAAGLTAAVSSLYTRWGDWCFDLRASEPAGHDAYRAACTALVLEVATDERDDYGTERVMDRTIVSLDGELIGYVEQRDGRWYTTRTRP